MSWEWLAIRGSGLVAFALLSASVIWGLLVSTRLLGKLAKLKALTWFHESLGISALIATAIHMFALSLDEFLPFTWGEILIPGRSAWKTLPVALGVVAFYTLVVVIGSFYIKKHIGQKVWRGIHFASFGLFISALLHGILARDRYRQPVGHRHVFCCRGNGVRSSWPPDDTTRCRRGGRRAYPGQIRF